MRRVKFCAGLFLAIIVLCGISLWTLDSRCDRLRDAVTGIQASYEEGNIGEAEEKAEELIQLWEKSFRVMSVLVDQDRLSEINLSISRIIPFLEKGSEEAAAELEGLQFQISLIKRMECPYYYNIL